MPIKCTLMFLAQTGGDNAVGFGARVAGWSETYYYPGTDILAARTAMGGTIPLPPGTKQLARERAKLLPPAARIIGCRYQPVNPTGRGLPEEFKFAGGATKPIDAPQVALQYRVTTSGVNTAHRFLHCFPDDWVEDGELKKDQEFLIAFADFSTALKQFCIYGRNLTTPSAAVMTITAGGLLTAETALAGADGAFVRVLRTIDGCDRARGGRFRAVVVEDEPRVLQLTGWNFGATKGGRVRLALSDTQQITGAEPERTGIKKVGRPFHLFRGRASNRQKRPVG